MSLIIHLKVMKREYPLLPVGQWVKQSLVSIQGQQILLSYMNSLRNTILTSFRWLSIEIRRQSVGPTWNIGAGHRCPKHDSHLLQFALKCDKYRILILRNIRIHSHQKLVTDLQNMTHDSRRDSHMLPFVLNPYKSS